MSTRIDFNLGRSTAGKTDLRVQFYDAAHATLGSAVTTGFFEWGQGTFSEQLATIRGTFAV